MYSICTQKVLVFGTNDPSAHPPHISSCFLCHPASKRGSSNVPSSPTPGRATCGGYRCSSGPTPSSSRAPASWKLRTWSLKGALDFERCGWTILTGVKGSACFTQFLSARTSKHRTKGRERERERVSKPMSDSLKKSLKSWHLFLFFLSFGQDTNRH